MPKSVLRYDLDKDLILVGNSVFTQSRFPNKKPQLHVGSVEGKDDRAEDNDMAILNRLKVHRYQTG